MPSSDDKWLRIAFDLDGARDRIHEQSIFVAQRSEAYAKSQFDPGSLTREELIAVSFIISIRRNSSIAAYDALENGIIREQEWKMSL